MAKQKNDRTPRRDQPPSRSNAARDAAIYRRVVMLRDINQQTPAAEYGLAKQRISPIITAGHCRLQSARAAVGLPTESRPYGRQPSNTDRDREIYERVYVTRELSRPEAAAEERCNRTTVEVPA